MSRRSRLRELAARTSAEHEAISGCVRGFEASLAMFASVSTRARRRIRRELRPLIACLSEHVDSAESTGGLLAEIEVDLGRSREVSTARRLHRSAARQADELSRTLADTERELEHDEIAKLGRRLASAVRRHHELEADLILMAFDQDIGVGD